MNYKFAFVLEATNDYLRKVDLSYMDYFNLEKLQMQFEDGIVYIFEDVNCRRADEVVAILKEKNIAAHHVNALKWKSFPKLQQTA